MDHLQGHPQVHECTPLQPDHCATCWVYMELARRINCVAAAPPRDPLRHELRACRRALRTRPAPGATMSPVHRRALAEAALRITATILGEPYALGNLSARLAQRLPSLPAETEGLLLVASTSELLYVDEHAEEPLPRYASWDPRQPPPYEEPRREEASHNGCPPEEIPHEDPPPYEGEGLEGTEQ